MHFLAKLPLQRLLFFKGLTFVVRSKPPSKRYPLMVDHPFSAIIVSHEQAPQNPVVLFQLTITRPRS